MTTDLSRRTFIASTAVAAAGLTLRFTLHGPLGPDLAEAASAYEPNTSLTITPDGLVTVHILKAEMGQGVGTALAQIVAEELEADWKDIRIDYPTSDPKYGLMLTGGSWSVNWTFDTLSRAGAAARMALIDAAANQWKVPASECIAARSAVGAKGPITKPVTVVDLMNIPLKKPAEYKGIGQWIQRLDIPEKTNGRAKFGIDNFVKSMAYAKVAYPPTREGGKHTAVDDSAAKKVKGYVKTVITPDLVAVLATSYEASVKARDALKITWDPGPNANVSSESIFKNFAARMADPDLKEWYKEGEVATAPTTKTHTATYTTDYVAHMQLEPMNCVARYEGGVYDLYTGSQFQTRAVGVLAAVLKVEPTKVRIHQQYLGGGFGRRLDPDIILEAALIAREAGRPVKLLRSREEDLQRDF